MRDRFELLRRLLRPDGFICCHIDDSEGPYLKVLMDEVFARSNYLTTIYVQVRYPEKTLKQDMDFHKEIEYVHVYRKEYGAKPNLPRKKSSFEKFSYYIEETGPGKELTLGGKRVIVFDQGKYEINEREGSEDGLKEIWATGTILDGNSSGRFFRDYLSGRVESDGLGVLYKVFGIGDDKLPYRYFTGPRRANATKGKYFQGVPMAQLADDAEDATLPIENFYDFAGNFGNCRHEGGVEFRSGKKPEVLLSLLFKHFSDPGDWVLDSFAGSGTSGAVAHKMGRRWIMVELREQCDTHILPRMRSVVNGIDQTGISTQMAWKGGGGFRYYHLAPSLLEQDKWGRWVISKEFNAAMMAEAVCKLEGFQYAPSDTIYWQQGYSTERDFLYVTTQHLTADQLHQLSDDVGPDRTLLVLCTSFRGKVERWSNLTVKKIPKQVLSRCEWGHDDYSLKIENLPSAPKKLGQPSLFDLAGGAQ